MKNRIIVGICVLLALVLLFPIPVKLKDGGSIEYNAILYQVKDIHMSNPDVNAEQEYIEGTIIKILGTEVYNNLDKVTNKTIHGEIQVSATNNDIVKGKGEPTPKIFEVMESTVAGIGRGTLKTAVELSEEDANILARIINNGSWIEEPTDCENDFVINLKGHLTYYHSNSGTLNKYNLSEMSTYSSKVQEINGKSLVLSEEERITVNAILQKYITFTTDNKPTE